MKTCSILLITGKCESKPQWNTILHPLEWLLLKRKQQKPKNNKCWRGCKKQTNKQKYALLVGIQNHTAIMENSIIVPQKIKHGISIRSSKN